MLINLSSCINRYLPSMLVANPTSLNLRPGVARPLSCPVVGYTGRRYCPGRMELGGCCAGLGVGAGPVVVVCSSLCVVGTDGSASSSAGTGSLARRRKEPSRCLCSHAFWRTLSSFRFFSSSWGEIKILIVIIVNCKSNKKIPIFFHEMLYLAAIFSTKSKCLYMYLFSLFVDYWCDMIQKVVYLGLRGVFAHPSEGQGAVQRKEVVVLLQ